MQLNRDTFWLCLILLAATAGCDPPAVKQARQKLVGKWEGEVLQVAEDALKKKESENPLAGAIGMMLAMAKPRVEFTADGKMSYSYSVLIEKRTDQGTWRVIKVEGNLVTLKGKLGNESEETEKTITLVDDDTLEMSPPAGSPIQAKVKFRRVKQP